MPRWVYGPIGRVRGKDVFLTRHAIRRIRERGLLRKKVLEALSAPHEVFLDKSRSVIEGFRRIVYVRKGGGRYPVVVVEEDDTIVVVTTIDIGSGRRYMRLRNSRVRGGVWIELKK
ncbi:MAG: DUF4258 domain-containing protein [Desulfurococcales archaeon]|nr:DUF4258 domain-containing protein [Desulfurococcales archaeon]